VSVKRFHVSNRLLITGKGATDEFDLRNRYVVLAYNYDALTVRLEAQCKLREERERENDALTARVARLEEALKQAAEDLQLVGDDYPGSSCHKWCSESAATARAALADRGRAALNELHQIDQEIFGQQATPGDGHGT